MFCSCAGVPTFQSTVVVLLSADLLKLYVSRPEYSAEYESCRAGDELALPVVADWPLKVALKVCVVSVRWMMIRGSLAIDTTGSE